MAVEANSRIENRESQGGPTIHESRFNESQFLRDLLELVALDDVAYLIFVEVAQLDPALQADAHFLQVILETAQRLDGAFVDYTLPPNGPHLPTDDVRPEV